MNMGNDTAMMRNMMKDPVMMSSMMTMMMPQCETETAMCRQMCTKITDNPKMMEMMHSMLESNKDKSTTPNGKLDMELHK